MKVDRGIAGIIRRRFLLLVFGLEALEAGPGFNQRAVDSEMLVAGQALCAFGNYFWSTSAFYFGPP